MDYVFEKTCLRKYPWFIIYYNLFPHGDSVLFVRKAMLIAFVLKFFTFWYIISNYLSMVSLSHHSLIRIFSKYRNISLKNSSDCLYSGNIFSSSLKKKNVLLAQPLWILLTCVKRLLIRFEWKQVFLITQF